MAAIHLFELHEDRIVSLEESDKKREGEIAAINGQFGTVIEKLDDLKLAVDCIDKRIEQSESSIKEIQADFTARKTRKIKLNTILWTALAAIGGIMGKELTIYLLGLLK